MISLKPKIWQKRTWKWPPKQQTAASLTLYLSTHSFSIVVCLAFVSIVCIYTVNQKTRQNVSWYTVYKT